MWFLLLATAATGFLIYKLLFPNRQNFWKKYGVRQIDTSSVVSDLDIYLGRKMLTDADNYAYEQMTPSDKFCGIMEVSTPVLLLNDIDMLRKIMIKDFDHFVDRRNFFTAEDGILHKMVNMLKGDEWKGVRSAVSPTFTSGKIRRMMDYFNQVGKEWVTEFARQANEDPSGSVKIDVNSAINLYTIEVISNTVFGMTANVIKNPNSEFSMMAGKISDFDQNQMRKFQIRSVFPWLGKLFGITIINKEAVDFFVRILKQALDARMRGEVTRNDFLQLLVEAKKGELKEAAPEELDSFERDAKISTSGSTRQFLTEDIMNAQSVVFFFGGFSTTTTFITFVLYSLATHQEVQDKLRDEVGKIVKKDGSLDYDDVGKLVYLDKVVCEVGRKFPQVTRLERVCTREYHDPETGLRVPKGTIVGIPLERLHNDKRFYENPDKFDPEHFTPEKKAERSPYAFMPFGMGPRNCIGMRFAMIEIKSAVAHIVHAFKIEPTDKTPLPLQGYSAGFQVVPPKNLELRLTPIASK